MCAKMIKEMALFQVFQFQRARSKQMEGIKSKQFKFGAQDPTKELSKTLNYPDSSKDWPQTAIGEAIEHKTLDMTSCLGPSEKRERHYRKRHRHKSKHHRRDKHKQDPMCTKTVENDEASEAYPAFFNNVAECGEIEDTIMDNRKLKTEGLNSLPIKPILIPKQRRIKKKHSSHSTAEALKTTESTKKRHKQRERKSSKHKKSQRNSRSFNAPFLEIYHVKSGADEAELPAATNLDGGGEESVSSMAHSHREMKNLRKLHVQIAGLEDPRKLQEIVDIVENSGRHLWSTDSGVTFDFDLCKLSSSTIQQLKQAIQT